MSYPCFIKAAVVVQRVQTITDIVEWSTHHMRCVMAYDLYSRASVRLHHLDAHHRHLKSTLQAFMILPLVAIAPVVITRLCVRPSTLRKEVLQGRSGSKRKGDSCMLTLSRRLTVAASIILFMFYFSIAKATLQLFDLYPHGIFDPETGHNNFLLKHDMAKVAFTRTHQVHVAGIDGLYCLELLSPVVGFHGPWGHILTRVYSGNASPGSVANFCSSTKSSSHAHTNGE